MNLKSLLILAAAFLCLAAPPVLAAPDPGNTFGAGWVGQSSAALESGGELSVNRLLLQTGGRLYQAPRLFANWNLGFTYNAYDFAGPAPSPWEDIYMVSLGVTLLRPLDRQWTLLMAPSLQVAGEKDARVSESMSYGLFGALSWRGSDTLSLGIGAGGYDNLEEREFFPIITIDWQPASGWRLANPLRNGVTGPAGLELSWNPSGSWSLAAGGALRSGRFRLAAENSVANGIGEESLVPVWLRVSRQLAALQLNIYAGASLNGEIKLEDRRGTGISASDYADTAFFALYLSGSF